MYSKLPRQSHPAPRSILLLAGLLTLIAGAAAQAEDGTTSPVAQEIAMAANHAGLAAMSPDLKTLRMHLHHTLNCLAGPNGMGYDASQANPCQGLGMGALMDTSPEAKGFIQAAAAKADTALKTDNLPIARNEAVELKSFLEKKDAH